MNVFKKSFLFVVGAVAVAYEEAEKEVKKQRKNLEKMIKRVETKTKAV